jgi:hypothetical protein
VVPAGTYQSDFWFEEESNAITRMLYAHLEKRLDFHTRVKSEKDTVVVYDNRMVLHYVVLHYDFDVNAKRHHIRITPQAERPIPAKGEDRSETFRGPLELHFEDGISGYHPNAPNE